MQLPKTESGFFMIYSTLLVIHITAGFVALIGAAGAITTKTFIDNHNWHIRFGRSFFYGMVLVFVTTLPMTILRPNLFLFLIGIFSFYLAWSGWRMAVNRSGVAQGRDLMATLIMGCAAFLMIGWGSWLVFTGNGNGITLIVFGVIGGVFSIGDFRQYTRGPVKGKDRISAHLSAMMGATIAAVTAFLVVNIQTDPVWIAWIAPTAVIVPFIVYLNRKVLR